MPIVGLTTQTQDEGRGLPLIARLYKGEKRSAEDIEKKRPGQDLDYFRVEFEPGFEHLRETWEQLYGDKPEGFDSVFVAAPDVETAFSSWKEEWTAATMLHRCDGEYQTQRWDTNTNMYLKSKVACASNGEKHCDCKPIGRLALILPEFIEQAGILGYVLASTHAIHDILTIYRTLRDVQKLNRGTLIGVEFTFGRAKKKITRPKTDRHGNRIGGRQNMQKSLFYLWPSPEYTRMHLLPMLSQPAALPAPALPVGDTPGMMVISHGQDTAAKLGSGGNGERRIGAPATNRFAENIDTIYPPEAAPEVVSGQASGVKVETPVESHPAWIETGLSPLLFILKKDGYLTADTFEALQVEALALLPASKSWKDYSTGKEAADAIKAARPKANGSKVMTFTPPSTSVEDKRQVTSDVTLPEVSAEIKARLPATYPPQPIATKTPSATGHSGEKVTSEPAATKSADASTTTPATLKTSPPTPEAASDSNASDTGKPAADAPKGYLLDTRERRADFRFWVWMTYQMRPAVFAQAFDSTAIDLDKELEKFSREQAEEIVIAFNASEQAKANKRAAAEQA